MALINLVKEWREKNEGCNNCTFEDTEQHESFGTAGGSGQLQQRTRQVTGEAGDQTTERLYIHSNHLSLFTWDKPESRLLSQSNY